MIAIRIAGQATVLTALGLLLTCACSDGPSPDRAETTEPEAQEETEGVYQRPVDKARKVEDQLQDAAEKQERDIKEQEGGG